MPSTTTSTTPRSGRSDAAGRGTTVEGLQAGDLGPAGKMLNAITVDVEEHFQVSAFSDVIRPDAWSSMESRVEANTDRVLELLDHAGVQATFFILGWIGERHPDLVRRIAECGHEIGCHGHDHRLVHELEPEQFRQDVERSRKRLEDSSGAEVLGYRAPTFSIGRGNLWALDVLIDAGFRYDSSLFPVVHDQYGVPGGVRGIYRVQTASGRTILEIPPSTVRVGGLVLPVAGGGYLRLYPAILTKWAIRRLNRTEQMPAVVYIHPWEVDPEQPRVRASWKSTLRHYTGLRTTVPKLRDLLSTFSFGSMRQVLDRETDIPERRMT